MLPSQTGLRLVVAALLSLAAFTAIPWSACAQSAADSLAGQHAQCVDFRSGETFSIGAQHLLPDGSIASQWPANGAQLCLGTAKEIASVSVPDGEGGAIVVWVDLRSGEADLYAQHLTAAGAVTSGWPADGVALCVAPGFQDRIAAAPDGAGGALVVWQDYRQGPNGKIFAQRLTSAGAAAWLQDGIPVSADSADQGAPAIAADGSGGALVVWQDARGGDYDLRWAHIAADGTLAPAAGGAPLVNAAGDQRGVHVVRDAPGHCVAVWQHVVPEGTQLRAAGFDLVAPAPLTGEGTGALLASSVGIDPAPTLCAASGGGAWVAWSPRIGGTGGLGDIRVQRLTAAAVPTFGDTGLAVCAEPHEQYAPAICSDDSGGCIVAWEDYRHENADIFAQRVSAVGAPLWTDGGRPACVLPGLQYEAALKSDGAAGAWVTWSDAAVSTRAGFARARPVLGGALPQLVSSESGPGRAHLVWRGAEGDTVLYSVQRRTDAEGWQTLSTGRVGRDGLLVCEDRRVLPGTQATYRLAVETRTALVGLEEISIDIPLPMPLTLRFARMEDRGRTVRVSYVLETHDPASLELIDVAGRRVLVRDLGSPGAGSHEERFASSVLPSGVYFARLHQARQTRTARLTLIR
ncbi:MAG: hypothetical protein ABL977_03095 [Candidatus Eisenbacteria bacterium]